MVDDQKISRAWGVGFLLGVLVVVLVNQQAYEQMKIDLESCIDCVLTYGVPFRVWAERGFGNAPFVLWRGLIGTVIAGLVFSIGLGTILHWIMSVARLRRGQNRPQ